MLHLGDGLSPLPRSSGASLAVESVFVGPTSWLAVSCPALTFEDADAAKDGQDLAALLPEEQNLD